MYIEKRLFDARSVVPFNNQDGICQPSVQRLVFQMVGFVTIFIISPWIVF